MTFRELERAVEVLRRRLDELEDESRRRRGEGDGGRRDARGWSATVRRTVRAGRIPALAGALAAVAVLFAATAAVSQVDCTSSANHVLCVFSSGTPARASEVNANFANLKTWFESKVGSVSAAGVQAPNATVSGTLSVDGNTSLANTAVEGTLFVGGVSSLHSTNVIGNLAVLGTASFTGNVNGLLVTIDESDCTTDETSCVQDGGDLVYLDRSNDLNCPANTVLVDWNIYNCGSSSYKKEYICCGLTVKGPI